MEYGLYLKQQDRPSLRWTKRFPVLNILQQWPLPRGPDSTGWFFRLVNRISRQQDNTWGRSTSTFFPMGLLPGMQTRYWQIRVPLSYHRNWPKNFLTRRRVL